jgi:hypothetical protein
MYKVKNSKTYDAKRIKDTIHIFANKVRKGEILNTITITAEWNINGDKKTQVLINSKGEIVCEFGSDEFYSNIEIVNYKVATNNKVTGLRAEAQSLKIGHEDIIKSSNITENIFFCKGHHTEAAFIEKLYEFKYYNNEGIQQINYAYAFLRLVKSKGMVLKINDTEINGYFPITYIKVLKEK